MEQVERGIPIPDISVQGFRLGGIDWNPEQRLQFLFQGNKVKEAPTGRHSCRMNGCRSG